MIQQQLEEVSAIGDERHKLGLTRMPHPIKGDMDWVRHLQEDVKYLERRIAEYQKSESDSWRTIEDVCCGAKLTCVKCGKPHPCLCDR